MSFSQQGNDREALTYLSRYLNQAPLNNLSRFQSAFQTVARLHRQRQEWSELLAVSETYLKRLETVEKSREYLQAAIPFITQAHNRLAEDFYQKKDYASAVKHYLASLKYNEQSGWTWDRLGNCYLGLNQKPEAAQAFIRAIACPDTSWSYQVALVSSLLKASTSQETLDLAREKLAGQIAAACTLQALSLVRQKKNEAALNLIRETENSLKTKGEFSLRVARLLYEQEEAGVEFLLAALESFPLAPGATTLTQTILNAVYQEPERRRQLRDRIVAIVEKAVAENRELPETQEAAFSLIQLRYRYEEETEEIVRAQLTDYRRFVETYPESKFVTQALQCQADLYRQKLKDWAAAAAIYTDLVEKKNQKHLVPSLATCQARLGQYEQAIGLLRHYLTERPADHNVRLQLAQTLLEAGNIAEGISLLKELIASSANQYVRENATKTVKEYRQVVPENYQWPAGTTTALFLFQKTQKYFFTNAPGLKQGDPVLFQQREKISVFPWSLSRKSWPLTLTVGSRQPFSLTEPLSFIEQTDGLCQTTWKVSALTSPETWRKEETYTVLFPWAEIKEKSCAVTRVYQEESDGTITLTVSVTLPSPGPWQLEVQTSRWQKIEKVEPEPDQKLGSYLLYQNLAPETKPFVVTIKGKLAYSVEYVYPKVTLTSMVETTAPEARPTREWKGKMPSGLEYSVNLPEEVQLVHLVKQEETVYELDEKMEWR